MMEHTRRGFLQSSGKALAGLATLLVLPGRSVSAALSGEEVLWTPEAHAHDLISTGGIEFSVRRLGDQRPYISWRLDDRGNMVWSVPPGEGIMTPTGELIEISTTCQILPYGSPRTRRMYQITT